jgi:hypothetical protein
MYEYRLSGPTWPFFMIHDQSYEVCETKEKLTQGAKNRYTEYWSLSPETDSIMHPTS